MGCFASKPEKHPVSNASKKVTTGKSRIESSTNRLGSANDNTTANEKIVPPSNGHRLDESITSEKKGTAGSASDNVAKAAAARQAKFDEKMQQSKDKLKAQSKLSKAEKGL